jgi:hypothetical protein
MLSYCARGKAATSQLRAALRGARETGPLSDLDRCYHTSELIGISQNFRSYDKHAVERTVDNTTQFCLGGDLIPISQDPVSSVGSWWWENTNPRGKPETHLSRGYSRTFPGRGSRPRESSYPQLCEHSTTKQLPSLKVGFASRCEKYNDFRVRNVYK